MNLVVLNRFHSSSSPIFLKTFNSFRRCSETKPRTGRSVPGANSLPLAGDFYCFPDYQLVHNSGVETAIELFHPWHQGHLIARLNTLAEQKDVSLILGVSKELEKKTAHRRGIGDIRIFLAVRFHIPRCPDDAIFTPNFGLACIDSREKGVPLFERSFKKARVQKTAP